MKAKRFLLAACALAGLWSAPAASGQIYVTSNNSGTVGKYDLSGALINAALISGLSFARGIAVSGDDLYVARQNGANPGVVGRYSVFGSTIDSSLIYPLTNPQGVAVSGTSIFVAVGNSIGEFPITGAQFSSIGGTAVGFSAMGVTLSDGYIYATYGQSGFGHIGRYTLAGALVNNFNTPIPYQAGGIVVAGHRVFVTNYNTGAISEYADTGELVNAALVSGLSGPAGLALFNDHLYVANLGGGTIGEYTLSGATVNAALATGLDSPYGITVVPEPSTWLMLAMGGAALVVTGRRKPLARQT